MPGIRPPYRSRKLLSFSKEWIGYSDDYGLIGIPFGLLLIAIGCGLPILVFVGHRGACRLELEKPSSVR